MRAAARSGYLSAVSAVEAERLGERGVAQRIVVASIPFFIGFTVVFVALGAGAAAIGGYVDAGRRNEIAGFVLVVLGLAFMGLLPWPERIVAPGMLEGARRSGSSALLGAAFAVCRRRPVCTVLASVLVLAATPTPSCADPSSSSPTPRAPHRLRAGGDCVARR